MGTPGILIFSEGGNPRHTDTVGREDTVNRNIGHVSHPEKTNQTSPHKADALMVQFFIQKPEAHGWLHIQPFLLELCVRWYVRSPILSVTEVRAPDSEAQIKGQWEQEGGNPREGQAVPNSNRVSRWGGVG